MGFIDIDCNHAAPYLPFIFLITAAPRLMDDTNLFIVRSCLHSLASVKKRPVGTFLQPGSRKVRREGHVSI